MAAIDTYVEDIYNAIQEYIKYINMYEDKDYILSRFEEYEDEIYEVHHTNRFAGLRMMMNCDLLSCIQNMGHDVKTLTREGLGYHIFVHCLYQPNKDYEDFKKDDLLDWINMAQESIFLKDREGVDLIAPQFFDHIKLPGQKSLYYKMIHQICQLIASCDDDVDIRETCVLTLLELNSITASIEERAEQSKNEENNEPEDAEYAEIEEDVDNEPVKGVLADPLNELVSLVGLDNVKSDVGNLRNLLKIQKMRENRGMKTTPISYHCVFTGNPGTGKTTVARILADIYKELGILKSGHLVETDRSGLVADYVGQTATKTNAIVDKALDGVLFVDEAYSLVQGGQSDYGKEAISTLLKRMEDDRSRLIVILAGYSREMEDFINSNSGLKSRFSRFFEFQDYTADELFEIFKKLLEKNGLKATDEALSYIKVLIQEEVANKDANFGNARYVRNLFESIITQQANRLAETPYPSDEELCTIEIEDVETFC